MEQITTDNIHVSRDSCCGNIFRHILIPFIGPYLRYTVGVSSYHDLINMHEHP